MKTSHPVLLAGLILPAFAALSACTGTEPAPTPTDPNPGTAGNPETAQTPTGGAPQDPQDRQQQREAAVLADSIRRARRSLEIGNWAGALKLSVDALRMDPNSAEARNIFDRASELLGEKQVTAIGQQAGGLTLYRVQQQRDQARATREAQVGAAHMAATRYDSAVESFERAVTILRHSPFYSPGSALAQDLAARLNQAKEARTQARVDRVARNRAASEDAQQEVERRQYIAQVTRARRLFEDANRSFQQGRYDACLRALGMILRDDAFHRNALALKDLASRARHDTRMESKRREWKAEWAKTFDNLNMADLPQTEIYKYDLARWKETLKRQPLVFASQEEGESPAETAILAKLHSVKQDFNFANASLNDWARYFSDRTEVNFVVTTPASELDTDATTLNNFRLPAATAARALDVIGELTGVKWKVLHGVVQLVTDEFAGGRMTLRSYGVRDIVNGVPDKPGIEPKLTVPGEEEELLEEDEEPKPTVVDAGKLQDLIRENIAAESWDAGKGANLTEMSGTLLVRHTKAVHKQINKLLADLREAVGIQIDVETRFLQVTDNFLEDLGVDFRGLGNDSSEGVAGRGLANRPNVGFDDFGRRETINPASPGELGSGTEPGIFYNDGGDGDIFGRTEQLFDNTLGSTNGDGLQPSGGLSAQFSFLDDTEVELILRAVAKNDRSQEITAPRLLVYNNTRANMAVLRQTTYIKDFEVEIAQAAAVANPVVGVVKDGVSLDVRPVVSADRKFITMELRPTVLDLTLPIPVFTTTLGVGQPITIQLPETTLRRVRTTVTMPDGGTVLLGGMKLSTKKQLDAGVPILKQIPIISYFFGRRGTSIANSNLLILIRASIIIPAEHEPPYVPDPMARLVGGGR